MKSETRAKVQELQTRMVKILKGAGVLGSYREFEASLERVVKDFNANLAEN